MLPSPYLFNHSVVYVPRQPGFGTPFVIDPAALAATRRKSLSEKKYLSGLLLNGSRSRFIGLDQVKMIMHQSDLSSLIGESQEKE